MKIKLRVMVTVGVLLLTATGCDDARLKAFSDFAACGSAYVAGFHSLTKAVAEAEMAKSNSILLDVRERMYTPPAGSAKEEKASQKSLQQGVETNTKILQEYLKNLRKLDAHATALGAYFKELASYTSDKNSDAISSSTQALADSIESLAPGIEKMKFGTFAVGAARTTGNLVIAHIQVKTLEKILERGPSGAEQGVCAAGAGGECTFGGPGGLGGCGNDVGRGEQGLFAVHESREIAFRLGGGAREGDSTDGDCWKRGRGEAGDHRTGGQRSLRWWRTSRRRWMCIRILDAVEKMSGYAEAVQDGASSN